VTPITLTQRTFSTTGFIQVTEHGGKRPGAGRKRKTGGKYDSAYEFLLAVARGAEAASPEQRVAAARAVLPYEQPKRRATKTSPSTKALRATESLRAEGAAHDEWDAKSNAIRIKHSRGNNVR
jgi:hypothetical protein